MTDHTKTYSFKASDAGTRLSPTVQPAIPQPLPRRADASFQPHHKSTIKSVEGETKFYSLIAAAKKQLTRSS